MNRMYLHRQSDLFVSDVFDLSLQLGLLRFWVATQELRRLDRKSVLASAAQIFYTYFYGSNQLIKIDKVSVTNGLEPSASLRIASILFPISILIHDPEPD